MRSRSPSSIAKNASGAAVREKSPKKADRTSLVDGIDMPEVVRRYLDGESITDLAKENRVARRTMYRYVLAECGGERYREVVTEALVSRIADADEELENAATAGDPVRVTAAKDTCKYVRMDFERRRPALYGMKQLNLNVHELTVNAGLVGDLGEMLNKVTPRKKLQAPKDVDDAEEVGR